MFVKVTIIMDTVNIKSDSESGSSSKQLTFGVDRILSNEICLKKSGKFLKFLFILFWYYSIVIYLIFLKL